MFKLGLTRIGIIELPASWVNSWQMISTRNNKICILPRFHFHITAALITNSLTLLD